MLDLKQIPLFVLVVSSVLGQVIKELQPDDVAEGGYDSLSQDSPELCTRPCIAGEPPRACYYKLHLEPYTVLGLACGLCPAVRADCFKPQCVTADGVERQILTVNRRLPAPSIQVCKGDTIIADVINQMPGSSTSIHWHGIRQRLTPWMDGVPMVTQCPIMEGQRFRYRFRVDEAGTFFWHSHDGLQKADGIVGSLIVRQPDRENPLREYYDLDLPSHVVTVQDWMHTPASERLPGFLKTNVGQGPDSYLINGRGVFVRTLNDLYGFDKTPLAEFKVKTGLRYRFRIVSGSCLACPFRVTFQGHRLLAVAADDGPVQPVAVDSVVMSAGERYDVVLEADQPPSAYWIMVRGQGACTGAMQAAVLLYDGAPSNKPQLSNWNALLGFNPGYTLNPRNSLCTEASLTGGACVSQLQARLPTPALARRPVPDVRLLMAFGFHSFNNRELYESNTFQKHIIPAGFAASALINNITNMVPPSPLLTQLSDIPKSAFCSAAGCAKEFCECTHVIKIPLGTLVEFIIADTSAPSLVALTHPFHIHGHDFFVLEQGVFKEPFTKSLAELKARLARTDRQIRDFLPTKDTVTVPASGYAVVRIIADNPGFWFYHCHFAFHLTAGMSAIFQVGEPSQHAKPPADFPKCHQYLPADPLSLAPILGPGDNREEAADADFGRDYDDSH